jgi:hypothetical protein
MPIQSGEEFVDVDRLEKPLRHLSSHIIEFGGGLLT